MQLVWVLGSGSWACRTCCGVAQGCRSGCSRCRRPGGPGRGRPFRGRPAAVRLRGWMLPRPPFPSGVSAHQPIVGPAGTTAGSPPNSGGGLTPGPPPSTSPGSKRWSQNCRPRPAPAPGSPRCSCSTPATTRPATPPRGALQVRRPGHLARTRLPEHTGHDDRYGHVQVRAWHRLHPRLAATHQHHQTH